MKKVVLVKWLDHCAFQANEWQSEDDLKDMEPSVVYTIGHLVKEAKDHIIVAGTWTAEEGSWCCEMLILKSCIISKKAIKV